jgi:hypothetical protein
VDAFPLDNPFLPLAHVAVSLGRGPHTHSMPLASHPLPWVELSIAPCKLAFSIFFVLSKTTDIAAIIREFIASNADAVHPVSFEQIPLPDFDAHAFPLGAIHLSKVQAIFSEFNLKLLFFDELRNIDFFVSRLVYFDKFGQFILAWQFEGNLFDRLLSYSAVFGHYSSPFFDHGEVSFQLQRRVLFPLPFLPFYFFLNVVFHRFFFQRILLFVWLFDRLIGW